MQFFSAIKRFYPEIFSYKMFETIYITSVQQWLCCLWYETKTLYLPIISRYFLQYNESAVDFNSLSFKQLIFFSSACNRRIMLLSSDAVRKLCNQNDFHTPPGFSNIVYNWVEVVLKYTVRIKCIFTNSFY